MRWLFVMIIIYSAESLRFLTFSILTFYAAIMQVFYRVVKNFKKIYEKFDSAVLELNAQQFIFKQFIFIYSNDFYLFSDR